MQHQQVMRYAAEQLVAVMRNTEDWLRIQLNTCQLERAELLNQLTRVRIPVPSIERASEGKDEKVNGWANGALPSLDDPGDEVAALIGVRHGSNGELVYER